jgi:hypothetical protein
MEDNNGTYLTVIRWKGLDWDDQDAEVEGT